MSKPRTKQELEREMTALEEYMRAKMQARDWHAVADAAMDMRELEVELRLTRWLTMDSPSEPPAEADPLHDNYMVCHCAICKRFRGES